MTPDELAQLCPSVFHMAADGSWPSIRERGLLSTSALFDVFGYSGAEREAIETQRRPQNVRLTHPTLGTAEVRDNKPMTDAGLARCLVDMTPESWYRYLNARCFFWATRGRLLTMLTARPYRDRVHTVLTVDTRRLLRSHSEEVRLTLINTGATMYKPPRRGRESFLALADFPQRVPAELVLPRAVPDIAEFVISVCRMRGTEIVELIS